jgi:broad specificity phosphatase PhoE
MKIIFSRHGNTFAPGETAIWVGEKQDLPLVASGIQQAKNLAGVIQQVGIKLNAIYCGSLKRTSDYAKIIVDELHSSLKPIIDPRLNEIDYGNWSGLSSLEIQKQGGGDELLGWENFGEWPKEAGWPGSAEIISDEVNAFANDLIKKYTPTDRVLVIASNGRLRYFLRLIPIAFEQCIQNKNLKVATGNLCLLEYTNQKWHLKFWNKQPELLL